MKGNVNPFEPWRPTGLDVPPPIHAARPWRPSPPKGQRVEEPPFVEPADKPAAAARPSKPAARPRTPEPKYLCSKQRCAGEMRTDLKVVLGMAPLLAILGLVGLGWFGGTHLPRVAIALLAVATGLTLGVSVARRRSWYIRLGWIAVGLAFAGLAGWFVPTAGGISLWSAYRQVDELNALPAGDVAAFVRGVPDRKEVVAEFPSFAEDIAAAEQAWVRRSVDGGVEDADRQIDIDPAKALTNLHQLNAELSRTEHYALVRGDLEAARRRALQASLKAAREEIDGLMEKKQFDDVARRGAFWADQLDGEAQELGEKNDLPDHLMPKRRQAVAARLESARQQFRDLLIKDDHKAIAALGGKLARELGDEARAVGLADDLNDFCTGCAAIGDVARQAAKL
jgi:hypothetical protein